MVEFEVDIGCLKEADELGCIVLHDENGEMNDMKFVPEKTCHIEHWGGSVFYLSCGHEYQGRYQPNYCPHCGASVIN